MPAKPMRCAGWSAAPPPSPRRKESQSRRPSAPLEVRDGSRAAAEPAPIQPPRGRARLAAAPGNGQALLGSTTAEERCGLLPSIGPSLPGGSTRIQARASMSFLCTKPNRRESLELFRLSPMTK